MVYVKDSLPHFWLSWETLYSRILKTDIWHAEFILYVQSTWKKCDVFFPLWKASAGRGFKEVKEAEAIDAWTYESDMPASKRSREYTKSNYPTICLWERGTCIQLGGHLLFTTNYAVKEPFGSGYVLDDTIRTKPPSQDKIYVKKVVVICAQKKHVYQCL